MEKIKFSKHNIVGENNPYWTIAEPILYDIWSDGILKATSRSLHSVNSIAWFVAVFSFLGGLVLRSALVASILFVGYLIIPQTLSISFDMVFSGVEMDGQYSYFNSSDLWLYELLGYVILIKSVIFLFGKGFKTFVIESCLHLLFFLTNMIPLRFFARGLKKENYYAQAISKIPLIGQFIVNTRLATPTESQRQWDKVFELYMNSNQPLAREELERLSEAHAQKSI